MLNAYFVVNDPPSEGVAPTFAAALQVLPRVGEVVSFEEGGPAYKVLLVQHHLGGAIRATLGPRGEDAEDVPAIDHELAIMVRAVTGDEQDAFIRLNEGRAAARLAPFLADGE